MILNTGNRTDIPAFYSDWFYNRIKAGYVMTRNPYNVKNVTKYKLSSELIDVICFCTKNPEPMLKRIDELHEFNQFWFVSITPYSKDVEPNVVNKHAVIQSFKKLSNKVGINAVSWRYDPIFINERYTYEYHIRAFEKIAKELKDYTNSCTISFIDLYTKTKKNFPGIQELDLELQIKMTIDLVAIAKKYDIKIYTCSESSELEQYGVDVTGCMSKNVLEKSLGYKLKLPKSVNNARESCMCILNNDIGMYNTCLHGCKYCYANYDMGFVRKNSLKHDVNSPLLVGNPKKDDIIINAEQSLFKDNQIMLF